MLLSRSLRAVFALAMLAPLSAAGTLTVGPAGSGAQFTEIQAAIDAALANDVVLVKPGTYQRIDVAKPLRILGDGTGLVLISGAQFGAVVHDIAAGEELVLSGLEVRVTTFSAGPLVLLQDCPGTVVLQDVNVHGQDADMGGVWIRNCARAVLLDSQIDGREAVKALDSGVWLANSSIHEAVEYFDSDRPALGLERSTLHLWRSSIRGGDGILVFGPKTGAAGGAGIRAVDSSVNLFGGPGSEVVGGRGAYDHGIDWSHPGGVGLDLVQGSSARIQVNVLVSGGLDGLGLVPAPNIRTDASSSHTSDPKVFPTLASSAQQVRLGSTFALTLTGNPGGYQVLFLSFRTGPTTVLRGVDGFGLLDRTTMRRVATEVLPPSATYTLDLRVPSLTSLIGATGFFQAAEQLGSGYTIGNPVLVTITG